MADKEYNISNEVQHVAVRRVRGTGPEANRTFCSGPYVWINGHKVSEDTPLTPEQLRRFLRTYCGQGSGISSILDELF